MEITTDTCCMHSGCITSTKAICWQSTLRWDEDAWAILLFESVLGQNVSEYENVSITSMFQFICSSRRISSFSSSFNGKTVGWNEHSKVMSWRKGKLYVDQSMWVPHRLEGLGVNFSITRMHSWMYRLVPCFDRNFYVFTDNHCSYSDISKLLFVSKSLE